MTGPIATKSQSNTPSANKLIHKIGAQTYFTVVFSAKVDLGENIFIPHRLPPRIDVVHDAVDLKVGDHLLNIVGNYEGVRLAGRLVNIAALLRHPVMLEVVPATLEHKTMNCLGVPMAR